MSVISGITVPSVGQAVDVDAGATDDDVGVHRRAVEAERRSSSACGRFVPPSIVNGKLCPQATWEPAFSSYKRVVEDHSRRSRTLESASTRATSPSDRRAVVGVELGAHGSLTGGGLSRRPRDRRRR